MATIRHRVGIAAPAERVYEALATTEGLASWWTRTVEGDPHLGGVLKFYFGGPKPAAVMEIVELVPNQRVQWRCVEGAAEWVGTTLTFDLAGGEDETVALFSQADWREPVEFMYHCSTKWAYFLLGLKSWLEDGQSVAYPNDMKISSWG